MGKKKKQLWFSITAKDCDFQTFKATGKGGQHRNKTESAVRCTHKDSGAVGECTEHKEQKFTKREAFKRMAESPKFKAWLRLKIDAGLGKVEIQEGEDTPRKVRMDEV